MRRHDGKSLGDRHENVSGRKRSGSRRSACSEEDVQSGLGESPDLRECGSVRKLLYSTD